MVETARRARYTIMPENNRTLFIFIFMLLCCLLALAGCAASQQTMEGPAIEAPTWPSGGETPRIRYVRSFSLPEDLQIRQGMLSRIWDYVVGAPFRGLTAPQALNSLLRPLPKSEL